MSDKKSAKAATVWPWLVGIALSASLVVAAVATIGAPRESPETAEDQGIATVGALAPDFEVTTLDGNRFSLADHRGQVVLVNFWGTWCAPCQREMPLLQRAYERHAADLVVVGIAVNDTKSSVEDFVSRYRIGFPVALDDGRLAGFYLVSGFPTSVIVDREGRVVARFAREFPDMDTVEKVLEAAGL